MQQGVGGREGVECVVGLRVTRGRRRRGSVVVEIVKIVHDGDGKEAESALETRRVSASALPSWVSIYDFFQKHFLETNACFITTQ